MYVVSFQFCYPITVDVFLFAEMRGKKKKQAFILLCKMHFSTGTGLEKMEGYSSSHKNSEIGEKLELGPSKQWLSLH